MSQILVSDLSWLNEFSKEEIILWIHQNCYNRYPKKSDVLFIKWQNLINEIHIEQNDLNQFFQSIDFKLRDELATHFNKSKDINERSRLIEKMKPYELSIEKYLKRLEILDSMRAKAAQVYNSINSSRLEE
ncbi:MAG: hypothetical protein GW938_07700 [Leptospira sp.]|nr:hypothetical protein [Leptospira sp.]